METPATRRMRLDAIYRHVKRVMDRRNAVPAAKVIDPLHHYTAKETAVVLNCSRDTALRIISRLPHIDHGTKETRYKRRKRNLRITGAELMRYIRSHKS